MRKREKLFFFIVFYSIIKAHKKRKEEIKCQKIKQLPVEISILQNGIQMSLEQLI